VPRSPRANDLSPLGQAPWTRDLQGRYTSSRTPGHRRYSLPRCYSLCSLLFSVSCSPDASAGAHYVTLRETHLQASCVHHEKSRFTGSADPSGFLRPEGKCLGYRAIISTARRPCQMDDMLRCGSSCRSDDAFSGIGAGERIPQQCGLSAFVAAGRHMLISTVSPCSSVTNWRTTGSAFMHKPFPMTPLSTP